MKKRNIVAFWDIFIYSLVSAILLSIAVYIITVVKEYDNWESIEWYCMLIYASCIAVGLGFWPFLQRIIIDLNCDTVQLLYLVNFNKNDRDMHTNWVFHPSQVEEITIVHLTKEEKKKYTSANFLFSKYLKIKMKYGNEKYVYVSHYSNRQISKIIKLITSNKQLQIDNYAATFRKGK